jgi:hypothetical protein
MLLPSIVSMRGEDGRDLTVDKGVGVECAVLHYNLRVDWVSHCNGICSSNSSMLLSRFDGKSVIMNPVLISNLSCCYCFYSN